MPVRQLCGLEPSLPFYNLCSSPSSRPTFSLFAPLCLRTWPTRLFVQALHVRTVGRVIEARIERAVEPLVGGDAAAVRHGVTGERIVDHGVVRARAG
jgi:hypothetical protein